MKRIFDFFAALIMFIILLPLFILLAILIYWKIGRPILFCQERPGLRGDIFKLYKFRTMKDTVDDDGTPLPDEQRMTTFGAFLRSTSLDELPSLWNVLKGNMSLVGPRPLLVEYLPLYSKDQARRHEVKPGITGWAQVNGRNAIGWKDKFKLDVWYVDNQSFFLDFRILWMTCIKVLKRSDINSTTTITMERFTGDSNE